MARPGAVSGRFAHLGRRAPGVADLLHEQRADLHHDLAAGLLLAAVALPVGVACAPRAAFDPVVGLYSSLLPLVAYALPCRQLSPARRLGRALSAAHEARTPPRRDHGCHDQYTRV